MSNITDVSDVYDMSHVDDMPYIDDIVDDTADEIFMYEDTSMLDQLTVSSSISKCELEKRILRLVPRALPALDIKETDDGYLMTPRGNNANVTYLDYQCFEGDDGDHRILVDGKFIKYVRVDLPGSWGLNGILLFQLLPPLPLGDWNYGEITEDPITGRATMSSFAKEDLLRIENIWHPNCFEYLEFDVGQEWDTFTHVAMHPTLGTVLLKNAEFEYQTQEMENETTVYQQIEGHCIGPKFLGHVAEEGRVIGFALGDVKGARKARPRDREVCSVLLAKLNSRGFWIQNVNYDHFVILDRRPMIIDFSTAKKYDDTAEMDEERERLSELHNDFSLSDSKADVIGGR